jgi:hypothetical protein
MACVCGHAIEEHRSDSRGEHECEVAGCECAMYEDDVDDDDDE